MAENAENAENGIQTDTLYNAGINGEALGNENYEHVFNAFDEYKSSLYTAEDGIGSQWSNDQSILLSLLLKEIPSQHTKDLLNQDWSKDYLNRLTSLSLDSLRNEPYLLEEEESKLEQELVSLAFREYKLFIESSECSSTLHKSLSNFIPHINNLLSTLPKFESTNTAFFAACVDMLRERKKLSTILQNYDSLFDILEISQLVDTCVRNGYYSEAMDLSSHVSRLVMRFPDIPLIIQIELQVTKAMQTMLTQLLRMLREPIKLPSCLKVVGYLRRMQVFEEPELRVIFLILRNEYLQVIIRGLSHHTSFTSAMGRTPDSSDLEASSNIPSTKLEDTSDLNFDMVQYLKKYIDVFREHFYDIITQFRAIFTSEGDKIQEEDNEMQFVIGISYPSLSPTVTATSKKDITHKSMSSATSTLLSDYTTYIINQLCQTLQTYLPKIKDTSSLSSLLTQLMYCGMSLGRIGADFRHLITVYFEDCVLDIVKSMILEACDNFIDDFTLARKKSLLPSAWMVSDKHRVFSYGHNSNFNTEALLSAKYDSNGATSFTPPLFFLEYLPLAYLVNDFLMAFNSLRLLAPISLYYPLVRYISEQLVRITTAGIIEYFLWCKESITAINSTTETEEEADSATRKESDSKDSRVTSMEKEKQHMMIFTHLFLNVFVDYIEACFSDGVFSGLFQSSSDDKDINNIEKEITHESSVPKREHGEVFNKKDINALLTEFLPTPNIEQ